MLILISFGVFAQRITTVVAPGEKPVQINIADSANLNKKVHQILKLYWSEGYLFAGIDSVRRDTVYIHKGEIVQTETKEPWQKIRKNAELTTRQLMNNGYPFAKYSWDSLHFSANLFTYKIGLDSGPFVLFDSLILINSLRTKPEYISRTLGITDGTPYSEAAFKGISKKMSRISFLELNQAPDVSFQRNQARTYLDVKESATGSFQGILGVLPNQASGEGVLITGNLDLKLLNLFRSGKQLNFSWAQFAEQSQRLEMAYRHPFIAGSSVHLNSSFKLFKQDTSFLNREISLAGSFYVASGLEMGFGYQHQNATVLTTRLDQVVSRNWLDFDQDWYVWSADNGIRQITKARRMTAFSASLAIGQRNVRKNINLPAELYDTVRLSTTNFKWESIFRTQQKLTGQTFLYGSISLAHLSKSGNSNQLYRVGGLQSLRGFNEQFFYTPTYMISQLEGRFFFEEQSYVFMFYDQGFLRNTRWQYPFGLGAGFSLNTNSGLFSFAMAVGRSETIPFELANMKIHFGYLSQF